MINMFVNKSIEKTIEEHTEDITELVKELETLREKLINGEFDYVNLEVNIKAGVIDRDNLYKDIEAELKEVKEEIKEFMDFKSFKNKYGGKQ